MGWAWYVTKRPFHPETRSAQQITQDVHACGVELEWETAVQRAQDMYADVRFDNYIWLVEPLVVQPVVEVPIGRDQ